jgi:hypothetical protein
MKIRIPIFTREPISGHITFLLLREVVWVILDQFRMAVFFCSCRCGHVGNALALSIMSTALLDARAVDL